MAKESLPLGGVTPRKYAAVFLALAMARSALDSAVLGEKEDMARVKHIIDITATAAVAKALGCSESDLAIIWDEHLSPAEVNCIKGWG
jgi:hypothetical protein